MSGEIRGLPPSLVSTQGLTGRGQRSDAASGDKPAADAARGDSVELTGTAARLKALEARLAELPAVDAQRVEAIRTAIAEGRFEVDSAELAAKLVEFESALE